VRDLWHVVERTADTEAQYFPALAGALTEVSGAPVVLVLDATSERAIVLAGIDRGRPFAGTMLELSSTLLAPLLRGETSVRTAAPPELAGIELTPTDELVAVAASSPRSHTRVVVCVAGATSSIEPLHPTKLAPFAVRAAAERDAALRNAEQNELASRRMRYASTLLELAPLRWETLDEGLRVILERTARALDIERASYWSLLDDGMAIVCEELFVQSTASFESGHRLEAERYPRYFAALKTCTAIEASDAMSDPRTSEFGDGYFATHAIGAMLDVPVWREGRLAGVICLEHVGPPRPWTPDDVAFARAIAQSVAIALERAARSSAEQRYKLVADAVGEVIWDCSVESGEIEWSDALHTQFRYPVESRATLAWWSSNVHPDDRERVAESLKSAFDGNASSWSAEYRFIRGDGTIAYVLDRGFIIRDTSGRAVRAVGSMHDITERRELERRLAISDRMASLGTLAAGVAHEINNPLFYVLTNIDVAIQAHEALGMDPDVLDALREARQGGGRIAEIVRSMRVFGRPEPAASNAVAVDHVVTEALSMAMNEIRHRARLVKSLGSPPPVAANETGLVQVVLNLVINAAQSIREGSADRDEITVTTGVESDGMTFIEVRDTGAGMTPETLAHVFDPFFTTKRGGHGMGLGLSITHSVVASFGGEIRVSSTPGKGSTFRVLLPRATSAAVADEIARVPSTSSGPGRKPRILIVDDEASITRALRRLLGEEHDIVVADGGSSALALLRDDARFDAVLCDVMMPDLTGADLHREIRGTLPELARRFVFMSGGAFGAHARDYVESTRQPTLAKPFDRAQLIRALGELDDADAARGSPLRR